MSKLFTYVDVDAETIAAVIQVAPEFVDTTNPPQGLGFYLVNHTLVSSKFLEELESEILPFDRLNCFGVTRVLDMFNMDYLHSLTEAEIENLGECVMLLIELGGVPLNFVNKKKVA